MKAVEIREFGDSSVLHLIDTEKPGIGEDEILVAVKASGINPIDYKTRQGVGVNRSWESDQLPVILGWDISGVVAESNSDDFNVGDEIFAMPRFPAISGCYAEYVAVPASEAVAKPANLTHEEAAAVPLAALTAWQTLIGAGDIGEGDRVLVHAAAGGVGHLAVQLAKWRGAHVIGTASAANGEFLKQLGVDEVMDYTSQNVGEVVKDVDVVLHTLVADMRQSHSWPCLKENGFLISITGPVPDEEAAANKGRGEFILVRPNKDELGQIAQLLSDGTLKVTLDSVYPLAEVAKAHDHVAAGHCRGKVVLKVDD